MAPPPMGREQALVQIAEQLAIEATMATNALGCVARAKYQHAEVARLHKAIGVLKEQLGSAVSAAPEQIECDCGGGEQGSGLDWVPHSPTCATLQPKAPLCPHETKAETCPKGCAAPVFVCQHCGVLPHECEAAQSVTPEQTTPAPTGEARTVLCGHCGRWMGHFVFSGVARCWECAGKPESPVPGAGWQPIATAKREPVAIIGASIRNGAVMWCCAVMWVEDAWVWEAPPDRHGEMSTDVVGDQMPVSHWMPIPAPQETVDGN